MNVIKELLKEGDLPFWSDGDQISVALPDDSKLKIITHGGNSMIHLTLPPAAIKPLEQSFDMTPTLVGDYLVDVETFRKMVALLSKLESKRKRTAHKRLETFASELKRMTATVQKTDAVKRLGQEKLRAYLLAKYGSCQVSGVKENDLLVASHIKPWAKCKDGPEERLDLENVLLLSANWDALFDRCYISFDPATGVMKKAARISEEELRLFGVPADWATSVRIPIATTRRSVYLKAHCALMEERDAKRRQP